eukprot:scaffold165033_cov17-Tisochrysis_lutea.AAC.1
MGFFAGAFAKLHVLSAIAKGMLCGKYIHKSLHLFMLCWLAAPILDEGAVSLVPGAYAPADGRA